MSTEHTLVLVGPMAAGKTSIGRRISRLLEVPFIDTDRRIVSAHGPIPEIFAAEGERGFREYEREAVVEALAEGGVVSLGGGAVTHADTRALLRDQCVVFLTVTPDAVRQRIGGGGRPLLDGDDPVATWTKIFEERRGFYEELATETFDTSRRPMKQIAEEIVTWRKEQR